MELVVHEEDCEVQLYASSNHNDLRYTHTYFLDGAVSQGTVEAVLDE